MEIFFSDLSFSGVVVRIYVYSSALKAQAALHHQVLPASLAKPFTDGSSEYNC